MKKIKFGLVLLAAVSLNLTRALGASPDAKITPGWLCSDNDDDFDKYDYDEQIARCKRHVDKAEKREVAADYGVAEEDWPDYEFDHLIPLCAGGANDRRNIWPQPLDEAKDKDKVEDEVCRKLRAGTMTQKQAVRRIWSWFDSYETHHEHVTRPRFVYY